MREMMSEVKVVGKCPCCKQIVMSDELYVLTEVDVYHLFCYNDLRKDVDEGGE
jgi:hypothetical protein